MYFHWQNLNERAGGQHGPGIVSGRAWLRLWGRLQIGWEWHLFRHFCHAYIETGGYSDADISASVAIPPFALFLHIEGLIPWSWHQWWPDRTVKLSVHDWGLWWVLWKDDGGWSSSTPRWRQGCWHPRYCLPGTLGLR